MFHKVNVGSIPSESRGGSGFLGDLFGSNTEEDRFPRSVSGWLWLSIAAMLAISSGVSVRGLGCSMRAVKASIWAMALANCCRISSLLSMSEDDSGSPVDVIAGRLERGPLGMGV